MQIPFLPDKCPCKLQCLQCRPSPCLRRLPTSAGVRGDVGTCFGLQLKAVLGDFHSLIQDSRCSFFTSYHVITSRNSHIAKLWLSVSFEVLWKGMNTCRGIAALVLGVLELNWEMLAAGVMRLSLSSHLSPPFR